MTGRMVNTVNNIIWSPVLVGLLIFAGIFLSVRTRFVQFRRIGHMARLSCNTHQTDGEHSVSAFQAFCLALSGRVGSGNIVGVATAIGIGGPGALFWMWLLAFLGAGTSFVESTLGQIYKYDHNGHQYGGPAAYIHNGLKSRAMGIVFSIVVIAGFSCLLTTVQSNGVAAAFNNSFNVPPAISGVALALLLAPVLMGGLKRIVMVSSVIAPFMSIAYILISLVIVLSNWKDIPELFGTIFTSAFGINPACGGILGSTISYGVKRGLFSNEAGQGSGAIISAAANADSPAQQGLVQAFSILVDTLVICTATGLMILSAGTYNIVDAGTGELLVANAPELGANFVGYSQAAISSILPGFGGKFIAIALLFFVFTSLLAYYYYVESSIVHLCHHFHKMQRLEKLFIHIFRIVLLLSLVYGAVNETLTIWQLGDIGAGLMCWINVIAILILSPKAIAALKDYESGQSGTIPGNFPHSSSTR